MKNWRLISQVLIVVSLICILLAIYGAFVSDIWLAPTQWLLVAAVSGILGIFSKLQT